MTSSGDPPFEGVQSAFDPQGPEAARVADLGWAMLAGAMLVFAAVLALAWWARRAGPAPVWLSSPRLIVVGGVVAPVVLLSGLLLYSFSTAQRLAADGPADLVVELTGYQWWWQLRYLDRDGRLDFASANELQVPVGATVEIRLKSADVLHSFWVPSLAGKLDLVPGRENRMRLRADRPGRFRGQCAEFCGGPHALMAMFVVAQPVAEFERWREAQRAPATTAADDLGMIAFMAHCAVCHAVRGTEATGTRGPDLSHIAGRSSLGAGILRNDAATLRRWIVANQSLKPGNLMPEYSALPPAELNALVAWLGTLQ